MKSMIEESNAGGQEKKTIQQKKSIESVPKHATDIFAKAWKMASTGGAGGAASGEGTHSSGGNAESGSQSGGMKEGWLEKKGDVNTNWRERWFTLANGQLEYFVDKEKTKKKGSISMSEIKEVGPLQHDSRSYCFGLNSGKRLWSLSASSAEVRAEWLAALRTYQPKFLDATTKVPQSAYGSIKKTLLKKNKAEEGSSSASTSSPAPASSSSSATNANASANAPTSPRTGAATTQGNNTQNTGSPDSASPTSTSPSTSPHSSITPGTPINAPNKESKSPQNSVNFTNGPPAGSRDATSGPTSPSSGSIVRSTTQIISNEPRATMLVPTTYANWSPKLAWPPTPERPAWCYELASNLAPELSAWLSPLLSAATRFNMGWAFILDWVRRIGNASFSDSLVLENIKQGMSKLTPSWNEFDKALRLAEAWDATHNTVAKLRNQIIELHGLVDAKVAGWHVQLAGKKAAEENVMEFTYKRQDSGTPERPAWFFIPSDASTAVADAFKIFEKAATIFNDNWQVAYETSKSISATNRQAAPQVKDTIAKALVALEPSWKEFELAIAEFEAWNPVSLYTLEVKQHVASLKRLHDSHKRDWMAHLDSRTSFVPVNKSDYSFEHDKPSTAERPAWAYKFNLQTPSEISRGLIVLSTASNIFNSNWFVAFDWANKIGKNMATRAAIREGVLGAFKMLETSWPHFETSITMLEPWETAATEIIRQVSQLRGLVEESRETWLARLATSQEFASPPVSSLAPVGDNFRLSGFGNDPTTPHGFDSPTSHNGSVSSAQSTSIFSSASPSLTISPSSLASTFTNDARSIYENSLAANREAQSITENPDAKLNFVPGLGPGSFHNCDIYRAVLKELYRAQQLSDITPDTLDKVRSLIVETQQLHRTLCFKWALHFAREGNMPRSIEYYEALHEVLPDACSELDKELMSLKAEFAASHDTNSMSLGSL